MGIQLPLIVGREGLRGRLETPLDEARRVGRATVRLDSGERFDVALDTLGRLPDGSGYSIPLSRDDVSRALGSEPGRPRSGDRTGALAERVVVPVLAEQLQIGKRVEEIGKVRVHKRVHEQTQTIEHPVLRERVSIDRVPKNQFVDTPPPVRNEDDVIVVPVVEEVIVFERRLVLREEIRIAKQVVEERAREDVTVKRESVDVERVEIPPATPRGS